MSKSIFACIAKHRKVLGVDGLLVFMGLVGQMNTENYTKVNSKEFAKHLDMRISHVNRAIERLLLVGLIIKGEQVGRYRIYRLNYHLRRKGYLKYQESTKNHENSLKGPSHLKLIYQRKP